MLLFRKPFFRASRGRWYVEITRSRQINLAKDRDEAFARYHELMAANDRSPGAQAGTVGDAPQLVVLIIDRFLD